MRASRSGRTAANATSTLYGLGVLFSSLRTVPPPSRRREIVPDRADGDQPDLAPAARAARCVSYCFRLFTRARSRRAVSSLSFTAARLYGSAPACNRSHFVMTK